MNDLLVPLQAVKVMVYASCIWAVVVLTCEAAKTIWHEWLYGDPLPIPPDSDDEE